MGQAAPGLRRGQKLFSKGAASHKCNTVGSHVGPKVPGAMGAVPLYIPIVTRPSAAPEAEPNRPRIPGGPEDHMTPMPTEHLTEGIGRLWALYIL